MFKFNGQDLNTLHQKLKDHPITQALGGCKYALTGAPAVYHWVGDRITDNYKKLSDYDFIALLPDGSESISFIDAFKQLEGFDYTHLSGRIGDWIRVTIPSSIEMDILIPAGPVTKHELALINEETELYATTPHYLLDFYSALGRNRDFSKIQLLNSHIKRTQLTTA